MSQPPDARREVGGGFVAPRVALPAVAALTSQLADGHCKVWTDVAVRRRWTSERRAGNPTDNGARQGESLEHAGSRLRRPSPTGEASVGIQKPAPAFPVV